MASGDDQRAVLVTGSTSGIGLATATMLAAAGWRVIVHGPKPAAAVAAVETIGVAIPGATVDAVDADLASQDETRMLAASIEGRYGRLDALVNNAAAVFDRWSANGDGVESTFAVNYLAPYLLTRLLLPAVERSGCGRIVNVASEAHRGARLDFAELQNREGYERFEAYERSKLAGLLFTYELARRTSGDGVVVVAAHPGTVKTDLFRPRNTIERLVMPLLNLRARSPEEGADTIAWLVSSDDAAELHGRYVADRKPLESSPESRDAAAAAELWDISAQMTGLP